MKGKLSLHLMSPNPFNPGEAARIRYSIHSPYSGRAGIVLNVDPSDERGAYLILFSDGLQFRYKPQELEPLNGPRQTNVLTTLYRRISETRQGLFRDTHSR